jgi:hypothetical protein
MQIGALCQLRQARKRRGRFGSQAHQSRPTLPCCELFSNRAHYISIGYVQGRDRATFVALVVARRGSAGRRVDTIPGRPSLFCKAKRRGVFGRGWTARALRECVQRVIDEPQTLRNGR